MTAPLTQDNADTLAVVLRRTPELLDELRTTITRTDNMAPERVGTSGHKTAVVPYNQAASDARTALETALRIHALKIAGYLGVAVMPSPTHHAAFLREHVSHMVGLDGTGVIYDELRKAVNVAWRAVDRRPERIFIGKCVDCGEELHSTKTAAEVKCANCRKAYDVAAQRADMLAKAAERVGTAAELARILPWFAGSAIEAGTIRKWHARGKLDGTTVDGRTVFKIGDVIALHTEHVARLNAPTSVARRITR